MNIYLYAKQSKTWLQFAVGIGIILLVSSICFAASPYIGYRIVALLLLMGVSLLALVFDILPVISFAILSALIWNFFFIPPLFTFHISNTEDVLMFLLYFIIALVHAVLTANVKKAERKNRDKEEQNRTIELYNTMLNSLSHELRTPLATILSGVDMLKEQKTKLNNLQEGELLLQLDTAAMRLNEQVENLLNMSRLESGSIGLQTNWCDIEELMQEVLSKINTSEHIITHTYSPHLPLFKVDQGLLAQAIYNILNNAITYTPSQSIIEITVHSNNDDLNIDISDNGVGLSEAELQKLFDKFYRAPGAKTGGIGLGLSIVKGFIEAHGGRINVYKNKKGGLTFNMKIPALTMKIHHE